jgi:hypothetical protein
MKHKIIYYIFSIGHRCNSTQVLKKHKLRNISSPFDYLFIDIESSFQIINNNFKVFLNDIVLFNKDSNQLNIYYTTNNIVNELDNLKSYGNITYMAHNYNKNNLFINQNFIQNISANLYNWNRICIFIHHNLLNNSVYNTLIHRCNIFKNIYKIHPNKLCLFYITKIIEFNDITEYKQYIYNLTIKYNITCYIIIIICSDKLNNSFSFENKILYIIKNVSNYNYQYNTEYGTDNNLNYKKEFDIIYKLFDFKLKTYNEIKSYF